MADLEYEKQAGGIVAGIDEVGRGPWAGPVVAAAVIIDPDRLPDALAAVIDDSKKLSAKKREIVAAQIPSCAEIGIGAATPAEIGELNILGATFRAMERAVRALPISPQFALVDGNRMPSLPFPAASIIAKVTRDRIMTKLSQRYAGYGWETNSGYGTAQHSKALEEIGVTPHHRKSFAPIIKILSLD